MHRMTRLHQQLSRELSAKHAPGAALTLPQSIHASNVSVGAGLARADVDRERGVCAQSIRSGTLCSPGCAHHAAYASVSVGCCRFMCRVTCQLRAAEYAAPPAQTNKHRDNASAARNTDDHTQYACSHEQILTATGHRTIERALPRVFPHMCGEMCRLI